MDVDGKRSSLMMHFTENFKMPDKFPRETDMGGGFPLASLFALSLKILFLIHLLYIAVWINYVNFSVHQV